MIIGFDAFPILQSLGGIAGYTRNLLKALLALQSGHGFIGYVPRGAISQLHGPFQAKSGYLKWVEVGRYAFSRQGAVDQLDIYHGTNFKLQTSGRLGTILTIHDLWLDRHPEYSKKLFGQRLSFYRTRRRARLASRIIAVSHFTASEVQELYGIPPSKISVIHLGVSNEFFPELDRDKLAHLQQRFGLSSRPYIFFVGGADPRKNHRTLFQAFAQYPQLHKTHDLIVVGSLESRGHSLLATRESLRLSEKIHCLGPIPKEELRLLYSFAAVFVYPSHYEGFGLPVLEAMACGAPVVTSNTASLPEVAGDAAILVDPNHFETVGQALIQVLQDSSHQEILRQRGVKRVASFDWRRTAEQTLQVYHAIGR